MTNPEMNPKASSEDMLVHTPQTGEAKEFEDFRLQLMQQCLAEGDIESLHALSAAYIGEEPTPADAQTEVMDATQPVQHNANAKAHTETPHTADSQDRKTSFIDSVKERFHNSEKAKRVTKRTLGALA